MAKNENVMVLDQDDRFMSYTNPAKARKLLKTGNARVSSSNPFVIKMKGEEGVVMKSKLGSFQTSWTKYFQEEKDVYVQNLGTTNIVFSFNSQFGVIPVTIPKTRKPLNLTQYVPFEVLSKSPDFRNMINRNPPILRLLTEDEFIEYYEKLSSDYGTTAEAEMRKAQDLQDALMQRRKPSLPELEEEMEAKIKEKEDALLSPDEPDAKVVGLCARADKDQGDDRISARDFIEELEIIGHELNENDWEFISTKGVYKTVKQFAQKKLEESFRSEDDSASEE